MALPRVGGLLAQLRNLLRTPPACQRTDAELVSRFAADRDESAFAALMERHGPMVWRVCRTLLGHEQDAEDAFQATFLILARKAGSLRKASSIASWLHGVATRVTAQARRQAVRRRGLPLEEQAASPQEPLDDLSRTESQAMLHEELARLVEADRAPLVLCYLEGKTQDEAAEELGWSKSTLRRRLDRGRERLALRLSRRGLILSAPVLATLGTDAAASAAPQGFVRTTAQLATSLTPTVEMVPERVLKLAQEASRIMYPTRMKMVAVALLAVGALGLGAGLAAHRVLSAPRPTEPVEEPMASEKARSKSDADLLAGTWVVLAAETAGRKMDAEELRKRPRKVLFRRARVRFLEGNKSDPPPFHQGFGAFQLDETKHPKTLDILYGKAEGPGQGEAKDRFPDLDLKASQQPPALRSGTVRCIYELKDDTLKLCCRGFDAEQPKDFTTRAGAGQTEILLVLQREAAPPPPKPETRKSAGDKLPAKAVAFLRARPLQLTNPTRTLVFSPDGKRMAFVDYEPKRWISRGSRGGCAHTLHLRETAGAEDVWTIEEAGPFGVAAFSPDGKTLAVSTSETVRLWETATGKEWRSFAVKREKDAAPPRIDIEALAFSPDGKMLAAMSFQTPPVSTDLNISEIRSIFTLWEAATGKELQHVRGAKGVRSRLAGFFPDGKLLGWEGGRRLTDLRTGAALCIVGPMASYLLCPFLSPDGKTCYWPSARYDDFSVHGWDVARDKELPSLKQREGSVLAVAFCPDGKTVATSAGSTIRVWEMTTGKELHMLRGHSDRVCGLAFSPDGKTLASGGHDGKVFVWDAATGKVRDEFRGHHGGIESVYFSPDGQLLVSSGMATNDKGQGREETFLWDLSGRSRNHH